MCRRGGEGEDRVGSVLKWKWTVLYFKELPMPTSNAPDKGKNKIKLFEERQVRAAWDEQNEKWWFSIVDVIAVLTESENPQTYWRVMKKRLLDEGNETVTNCNGLKMPAPDGKMRLTDVADTEQVLRLIQPKSNSQKMSNTVKLRPWRVFCISGVPFRCGKSFQG